MIQPISQVHNPYQLRKPVLKSNQNVQDNDSLPEFIDYRKPACSSLDNRSFLLGCAMVSAASLLIAMSVLGKGKNYGRSMARLKAVPFEDLKNDKNIPILSECKSLNSKMKNFLQQQINYANASADSIKNTGNPKPANMLLLYGSPGTGKSFYAKIFAKTLGAEYKEIKFSDFNSMWAGEDIERLVYLCDGVLSDAVSNPNKKYVVTFNEIDVMLQPAEKIRNRITGHTIAKLEERSVMLNFLDDIAQKAPNVTIIGTTNISPKNNGLDGAAISRFKNTMEVNYPDKNCLFEAIKAELSKMPDGENFVKSNIGKIENLANSLSERKGSYRDMNKIIDSSKNYYLEDYSKNSNAKFKFDYLNKSFEDISITDGEVSGKQNSNLSSNIRENFIQRLFKKLFG